MKMSNVLVVKQGNSVFEVDAAAWKKGLFVVVRVITAELYCK